MISYEKALEIIEFQNEQIENLKAENDKLKEMYDNLSKSISLMPKQTENDEESSDEEVTSHNT